jgi:hypothetical protein
MAVTIDDVAEYLGVLSTEPNLQLIMDTAIKLIDEDLKESGKLRCPEEIYDLAVLTCADQLWRRRNSSGGLVQWGPDGATPTYMPADVLKPVRPLYARYRPFGSVG